MGLVRQDHTVSTQLFQQGKVLKVAFYPHCPHFPIRRSYLEDGPNTRKAGVQLREVTAQATYATMTVRGTHSPSSSPAQWTTSIEMLSLQAHEASEDGRSR